MPMHVPRFQDRADAGRQLADRLNSDPKPDLVLALVRGGVPVAYEIATALGVPLDILLVRKIPAPGYEEYGIGAVVDGAPPQIVLNDDAASLPGVSQDYLDRQLSEKREAIERWRALYGAGQPSVEAKSVLLVDDGIATGGTALAGISALRQAGARSMTLAVPVAPPETLAKLEREAQRVVCLHAPAGFRAVGQFYAHFDQTSDKTVMALISRARAALPSRSSESG